MYYSCTRKRKTFVNTTAIAYGQKIGRSLMILAVCNSSCVHKRHAFASTIACMKENKGVQGAKPLDDFTSHTDPPPVRQMQIG